MERTSDFNGRLLVIGGKKLLLFELTSKEFQRKHRKKLRKQESRRSTSGKYKAKADAKDHPVCNTLSRQPLMTDTLPSDRFCQTNDEGTQHLIGDAYGRLAMLSLDSLHDQGLILVPLGEVYFESPRLISSLLYSLITRIYRPIQPRR
ncbi:uncharacterized protein STEHIDRAFT_63093 [Stereum hirsutum FP-91666 SS1]|uniref:uncharacterized protein n=1 Tax=Stereum hirsutum (strain FP-91666) TaxID=721885 RepID=UPI00044499A3|nr:uncharacterized protein STEHIDRAFT_63093 [Stereum hirsutum FP-91666 SS1]EIM83655.1 hypothetical protein STEHIDRAFT_63093 [Stereum hirsutum FP-91666 SS1]